MSPARVNAVLSVWVIFFSFFFLGTATDLLDIPRQTTWQAGLYRLIQFPST